MILLKKLVGNFSFCHLTNAKSKKVWEDAILLKIYIHTYKYIYILSDNSIFSYAVLFAVTTVRKEAEARLCSTFMYQVPKHCSQPFYHRLPSVLIHRNT